MDLKTEALETFFYLSFWARVGILSFKEKKNHPELLKWYKNGIKMKLFFL